MKAVQALSARELDGRIDELVGDPMLASFAAFVRAVYPDDPREERAKKVHLMVLAYLMRCEVESPH